MDELSNLVEALVEVCAARLDAREKILRLKGFYIRAEEARRGAIAVRQMKSALIPATADHHGKVDEFIRLAAQADARIEPEETSGG